MAIKNLYVIFEDYLSNFWHAKYLPIVQWKLLNRNFQELSANFRPLFFAPLLQGGVGGIKKFHPFFRIRRKPRIAW
jgi:hypothetical protein